MMYYEEQITWPDEGLFAMDPIVRNHDEVYFVNIVFNINLNDQCFEIESWTALGKDCNELIIDDVESSNEVEEYVFQYLTHKAQSDFGYYIQDAADYYEDEVS